MADVEQMTIPLQSKPTRFPGWSGLCCCGSLIGSWFALAFLLFLPASLHAQGLPQQVTKPQLKAAFVYNFLKFIEWPAEEENKDPIRIGLYGLSEEFGSELKKLQGKTVRSQVIEIVNLESLEDPKSLDSLKVLILNPDDEAEQSWLKEQAPKRSELLIIGEEKTVADQGGMIDFYTQRDRVRFRINRKRLEQANLEVSSKLLRLAKIVTEDSP